MVYACPRWIGFSSVLVASASLQLVLSNLITARQDPCAAIGGMTWVSPKDVRACYASVALEPKVKTNVIEVINKTLAFHASLNYELQAPPPYNYDVQEDLMADLARISVTDYTSEYDFHVALSRATRRLNDGHCVWKYACYDALFVNYLPLPLDLLEDSEGHQDVYISSEAFEVASTGFPDQIDFWQNALPDNLRGQLESLSGAKVLAINGRDPFETVDANAEIWGGYQALGTRQNAFFSSYLRSVDGWTYIPGTFARQSLPLEDQVELTFIRVNRTSPETITLPYRSRLGDTTTKPITDTASWRSSYCVAQPGTNGQDLYAPSVPQPPLAPTSTSPAVMLHDTPLTSLGSAQFYMLDDEKTGILVIGSFEDNDWDGFTTGLYNGLMNLKKIGATQLIVDVTNNGGGVVCAAAYLHRLLAGRKSSTDPQAELDSKIRAGPLAKAIAGFFGTGQNVDPDNLMLFNPRNMVDGNNQPFRNTTNWLEPSVDIIVNGRHDSFSRRIGPRCSVAHGDWPIVPPIEPLFDTKKVVIIGNGKCASACGIFSLTMAKHEGSKTVVLGGKKDVKQKYCGTIGGEQWHFPALDSEIKTAKLKDHPLAPPDLLVNGVFGFVWRLSFGIDLPEVPAEWQDHSPDLSLPLTSQLVNNPMAIWKEVTSRLLS
ncbi:hypothetical protein BDN72DRAFT_378506 [Pluteus cervinus]|uniref:Uncharacterized protein n=1 Tax=Pluteus cervinus TaxID=181527 RepID=A0ACD3B1E6_9AGAR|nr:hypothetical protein BDN72DRAFT_378506 [Pluteus cervinus]